MRKFSVTGLTAETFTDPVNINVYFCGKEINCRQWFPLYKISKP